MQQSPKKLFHVLRASASLLSLLSFLALNACNDTDFKGDADALEITITKEFIQDSYPVATTVHTQGHRGDQQSELFEQGEWGKLDILVVVDSSGSMIEEQTNLSTKLAPLLSHVSRADWQISVVTTDPAAGCQRALIKKSDANAATKFQNAVMAAGTKGTGYEEGVSQAVAGLKCVSWGQRWLRSDSAIAVLILSDEDNCSENSEAVYRCANASTRRSTFLTDYLSSIRTIGQDARVYGLIWHPSMSQSQCSTALVKGHEYAAAITATSGTWGSICDADYSPTLRAMSQDIAQILKYEFDLAHAPDDGTLQITVDGQIWDKFTLEGRHVKFTEVPPFGAKVDVSYRHGKEGELATGFPLEKAPIHDSIAVEVGGVKMEPGSYRWDDQLKKVVLTTAPGERSEVKFTYKEAIALNERFDIGKNADQATVAVTVDGQPVRGFTYDAPSGILTIRPAPAELAKIVVTFKEVKE